jgi:hypothetical protein
MPSNPNTKNPLESATDTQPKDKSLSQMSKALGFSNMNDMMNSYGLKRHNEEDFEEARAILEAFKQQDQKGWEASQRK